jgi:hypothetical protein
VLSICIATGASLTKEDVNYCKGKGKVYVINNAYRLAPWADVLYACDAAFWDCYRPEFAGEKWTLDATAAHKYDLNLIGMLNGSPFSNRKDAVVTGGNSGFQALNLAVIQGATKVILLGYDMQLTNGKKHYFGNHPADLDKDSNYKNWIQNFKKAAPHIPVPVINCTRQTALDCFEKKALEDVI